MYSASEEIRNEASAECVMNLMKNTGWSFEQACNVLKIPAESRIHYMNFPIVKRK